jgi:hypothetical protein
MNSAQVIRELEKNLNSFRVLLENVTDDLRNWKPAKDKWSLLEIVCHLYDEEREDFRTRVKSVLEDPTRPLPKFDPLKWVKDRNYEGENYEKKLLEFLNERKNSISWLNSLKDPAWDNAYQHEKLGPMSAELFLNNWLAHDYFHLRQIVKNKYQFLKDHINSSLDYAGNW